MAGSFYFLPHAVDRFRQRFAPGLSHGHALRELIAMSGRARRIKAGAMGGRLYFEIGDSDKIVLVCQRRERGLAVMTVLPPGELAGEHGGDPEGED